MGRKDILEELDEDSIRTNFLKYTRKAFEMLPKLDKPRILDIACGSGIPTLELSKLSGGEVVGIDIDQLSLDTFKERIEQEGLGARVKAVNCSMQKITLPDESFDIVWDEGAGYFIDFEKALKLWRLLKPNGYLVIHDDLKDLNHKLGLIPKYGYRLVEHFPLPDDAWWLEYFAPLEKRINELRDKYQNDPKIIKVLDNKAKEGASVRKNPKSARSVFLIMQKIQH